MARPDRSAKTPRSLRPPATTPEGRENQMISLAIDLAEKQLAEGTASATVITHYLKLATAREALERQKLALEGELLQSKNEAIKSHKRVEELYEQALNAMRSYSPNPKPIGGDEINDEEFY